MASTSLAAGLAFLGIICHNLSVEQSLDCFDDLSKEELEAVAYLDSVAPFRETIVCLKASLLRKIGRGGSSQLLFDITVQETTFNVVATSLDGSSLDLSLQKRSGRSIFPNYAHFLITDYGMLRVPNDGINVTPPEQPLQPYEMPGQKGAAPLYEVRRWLDPTLWALLESVSG